MSALLLKDFYTLIRQTRIFLIMIVIFAVLPGFNMAGFAIVYAAMLPITALAYDERSKWDALAATMPYTPGQIVAGKYILGYTGILLASVMVLLAQYVTEVVQHAAFDPAGLASVLYIACSATIILAACLPIMFKIGVEKGRIFLFILVAAVAAFAVIGGEKVLSYIDSVQVKMHTMTLIVVTACLILNATSMMLSIRFYTQKSR